MWRVFTRQRIGFFAAGALFAWAAFYIALRSPEIYEAMFHQGFNAAWAPRWYLTLRDIVGYLPLISIGIVALLRFSYSRRFRPVSYSVGVFAFYAVLFVIILIGFVNSPF
jgi:hypothetical protein